MSHLARILFVHNGLTRFVQIDRDLLSARYALTERYERSPKGVAPLTLARQVASHDVVFCWFASWHSLLPIGVARFAHKPSVLVIGGYDVANIPQIGYGSQRIGLSRLVRRMSMHWATVRLAFSCASRDDAVRNLGLPSDQIRVLHLGVPDIPYGLAARDREPIVLSVGNINRSNLQRKGHEAFVRVARLLPSARFVLAGRWYDDAIERLRAIAPPNVSFPGWLTDDELNNLYARSSVYVQLSLHEGFGMSAAEAMLAGCIPVVTRVGSLPEVVGDVGRYVDLGDSERILAALREGLAQNDSERLAVRKRIVTNFSLKRRQAGLYQVVDGLLSAHD